MSDRASTEGARRGRAEEVLAQAIARVDRLEDLDIDGLCAEHASLADLLRPMHAAWREVEAVFRAAVVRSGVDHDHGERAPVDPRGAGVGPGAGGGPRFHPIDASPGSRAATDLQPGDRLGEIEIVRSLAAEGRGGFGQLYEGWHRGLEQKVAVKVMLHEGGELEERFRMEAQSAARLRHTHIVAVLDLIEWRGRPVIVMEYMEGGSLEHRLRRDESLGTASGSGAELRRTRQVAEICQQVAAGLAHAHEHRIIHRDIKPANILLDEEGLVKVGDFGLAKHVDEPGITQPWQRPGTPQYMSPEQVAGVVALDARTDVYSLGVVLYRLLTGRLPFSHDDRSGLFKAILTSAPPRPRSLRPSVPPELEAICLHALEKDPDDRYPGAALMQEDLRRFLAGESTIVKVKGPIGRGWQALRTTRAATLVASAVALVVGWLAFDRLVLDDWVGEDLARMPWRAAALALVTLPFIACLGAAGSRVLRARRLGTLAGVALGLVLAVAGGLHLVERAEALRLDRDRAALDASLRGTSRRDVTDIEGFVRRWHERFEVQDVMRVVRGYVKRGRVTRAAEWSDELAGMPGAGIISEAWQGLLADLTGRVEDGQRHRERLAALDGPGVPWMAWSHIGDMYRETRRFGDALHAYQQAARREGAPRMLSLSIAAVLLELCRYDEAALRLQEPLQDRPDDPTVRALALDLARRRGDFDGARGHLQALASTTGLRAGEAWGTLARKEAEHALLVSEGRRDEALALVATVADARADDPVAIAWCARASFEHGERERAGVLYARLLALDPQSVEARVGLATARDAPAVDAVRRGEIDVATYLASLEETLALLHEALALDDGYLEAHYNLCTLDMRRRALPVGGNVLALGVEDVAALIAGYETAVEHGGLRVEAINNLAFFLAREAELTGEQAALVRAEALIAAALHLHAPDAESRCAESAGATLARSKLLDTLATVRLAAGHCEEARAAVLEALRLHPEDDRVSAEFRKTLGRIDAACP